MKRNFIAILVLQSLIFFLNVSFAASTSTSSENYTLDPGHTYVVWHINHFGFSNPSGKWMAEGNLVLDEMHPERSKVNAVIHIDTVNTGIPKLDAHLKEKDFFDAKTFPTATFVSNKIMVKNKNTASVYGVLTLRGVSHPVTLKVRLNKMGLSPITNKKTVGFSAKTEIKRSAFGMSSYLPGLSDEVRIDIEAEAVKSS